MNRGSSHQRGMSLVAALFVIVVLAMLSLFAVRIGGAGEQDVSSEVLQGRALAAARSGIEYGWYRATHSLPCAGTTTLNLTQGALAGFTVRVTCTTTGHSNPTYKTYYIDAVAQRGTYGWPDYVSRRLTKSVR